MNEQVKQYLRDFFQNISADSDDIEDMFFEERSYGTRVVLIGSYEGRNRDITTLYFPNNWYPPCLHSWEYDRTEGSKRIYRCALCQDAEMEM